MLLSGAGAGQDWTGPTTLGGGGVIVSSPAGKSDACQGCPNQLICASAGPAAPDPDIALIAERLQRVKHKVGNRLYQHDCNEIVFFFFFINQTH